MMHGVLYYGSPEPSLREKVAEEAKTLSGSYVLLVPDQHKLEMEQELGKLIGGPLLHAKVMSFRRLAERIVTRDVTPISRVGKRLYLSHLMREHAHRLELFHRHSKKHGFVDDLAAFLSEMDCPIDPERIREGLLREAKKAVVADAAGASGTGDENADPKRVRVDAEGGDFTLQLRDSEDPKRVRVDAESVLPSELDRKIRDINLLYEAFSGISEKYIGDEKLICYAASAAERSEFVRSSKFYISGYQQFTDNELALFNSLCRHSLGVEMTLDFVEEPSPSVYDYPRRLFAQMGSHVKAVAAPSGERGFFFRFSEAIFAQDIPALAALLRGGAQAGSDGRLVYTQSPVEVYEAERRFDEVAFAAAKIRSLLETGVRPSEITVVCTDFDAYASLTERLLAKEGIPYFIDSTRTFAHHPLAEFIDGLLQYQMDGGDEALLRMLRSGVFPVSEAAALRQEIRVMERRERGDDLKALLSGMSMRELGRQFSAAALVRRLFEILQTAFGKYSVMRCCELHSKRLLGASGETAAESDYGAKIWNQFVELLEELHELSDITGPLDFGAARRLLADAFSELPIGRIPSYVEYVSITSPSRLRRARSRICFVLGAVRGELPRRMSGGTIFRLGEQSILEMSGGMQRFSSFYDAAEEAYNLHLLLTAPSEKLYFTYPGGSRSVVLNTLSTAFAAAVGAARELRFPKAAASVRGDLERGEKEAALSGEHSPAEERAIGAALRDEPSARSTGGVAKSDDAAALPSLTDLDTAIEGGMEERTVELSPSTLEKYLGCPFQYYVNKILYARDLSINEVNPATSGTITHRALEKYANLYLMHGRSVVTEGAFPGTERVAGAESASPGAEDASPGAEDASPGAESALPGAKGVEGAEGVAGAEGTPGELGGKEAMTEGASGKSGKASTEHILACIERSEPEIRRRIEKIFEEDPEIAIFREASQPLYRRRFLDACVLYAQVIEYHLAMGDFVVANTEYGIRYEQSFTGDFYADFSEYFSGHSSCPSEGAPDRASEGASACLSGAPSENTDAHRPAGPHVECLRPHTGPAPHPQPFRVRFSGTIDRLDVTPGAKGAHYRIVDYKTGKKQATVGDFLKLSYVQLAQYDYAMQLLHPELEGAGLPLLQSSDRVALSNLRKAKKAAEPGGKSAFGKKAAAEAGANDAGQEGRERGEQGEQGAQHAVRAEDAPSVRRLFAYMPMFGAYLENERTRRMHVRDAEMENSVISIGGNSAGKKNRLFVHDDAAYQAQRAWIEERLSAFPDVRGSLDPEALRRLMSDLAAELAGTKTKSAGPAKSAASGRAASSDEGGASGGSAPQALAAAPDGVTAKAFTGQGCGPYLDIRIMRLLSKMMLWVTANGIAAGRFEVPREAVEQCEFCSYKAICRMGAKVADEEEEIQ